MLVVAALGSPAASASIVIDFEQFSETENITELAFTQNGVDIQIYRLADPGIDTSFKLAKVNYAPFGNVSLSPFNGNNGAKADTPFVIEFSVPILSFSVRMGDWGEDADSLLLVGYEGPGLTGASASASGNLPAGPNNVFTNVSLVLRTPADLAGFRSYTMQGGGVDWPNSVFYDNIHAVAVPEASAVALLAGLSLIGVAAHFRRRTEVGTEHNSVGIIPRR